MTQLLSRTPLRTRALLGAMLAIAVIGALGITGSRAAHASGTARGSDTDLVLTPLAGAPNANGTADLEIHDSTLEGSVTVNKLPVQSYGSGHFYGFWFVRTDTGNKAFLGALQHDQSIIFSSGGNGKSEFAATHYTTGPGAGSAITLGPKGTNLFIVLIETTINGLTPSPVAQAASGTL